MTPARPAARGTAARPPAARDRARALAIGCARAADEKIGEETLVLDVRGRTSVCDFIVVTTATSTPHLKALADAMQDAARALGSGLHHREGDPGSPWVLLDFVDVIAHVFDSPSRRYYELERLWADVPRLAWQAAPAAAKPRRPRKTGRARARS